MSLEYAERNIDAPLFDDGTFGATSPGYVEGKHDIKEHQSSLDAELAIDAPYLDDGTAGSLSNDLAGRMLYIESHRTPPQNERFDALVLAVRLHNEILSPGSSANREYVDPTTARANEGERRRGACMAHFVSVLFVLAIIAFALGVVYL